MRYNNNRLTVLLGLPCCECMALKSYIVGMAIPNSTYVIMQMKEIRCMHLYSFAPCGYDWICHYAALWFPQNIMIDVFKLNLTHCSLKRHYCGVMAAPMRPLGLYEESEGEKGVKGKRE